MTGMRIALTLLAASLALALVAAGCGGSTQKTGGAGTAAAAAVPSSVSTYVELDADLASAQWQKVPTLADDLRAGKGLFKDLFTQKPLKGADWATIDAAVGPVIVFALLEDGKTAVLLTQPDDAAKLQELAAKDGGVTRVVDGWTAVAENAAALDAYEAALGKGSLADDAAFTTAMDGVPAPALIRAFAGGSGLGKALAGAADASGSSATSGAGGALGGIGLDPSALSGIGGGDLKSVVAAVEAIDGGLRLSGSVESAKAVGTTYTPAFLKRIPAGVIAAADWHGTKDILASLRSNPDLTKTIAQLETALGVTLDQLDPLVAGEGAFYVRAAVGVPEITVALEVPDEAAAMASLDGIMQRVVGLVNGKISDTTVDGVAAKVLDLGIAKLTYAAVDGMLIATTSPTGIADFRSTSGDKLADDPAFAAAAKDAGLGDTTSGFVYADVGKSLELLNGLGGLLGASGTGGGDLVPSTGLEHFGTALVHLSVSGTTTSFAGVVSIK